MSGHDAFEEEMLLRSLSDEQVDQLLAGHPPEGSDLVQVAEFAQALGHTLPAHPARNESDMIAQLVQAARAADSANRVEAAPITAPRRRRRFRILPPRATAVARVAAALACVPLLFAGLAVAGVDLPEPARDAFEAVGVSLPNQPAGETRETEQSGDAVNDTSEESADKDASEPKADKEKGQGSQADKRGHGTEKANPARAGGRANGEQGRGRALGKRGLAPGQIVPPGQLKENQRGKGVGKNKATPPAQTGKPSAPSANDEAGTSRSESSRGVQPLPAPKGGKG